MKMTPFKKLSAIACSFGFLWFVSHSMTWSWSQGDGGSYASSHQTPFVMSANRAVAPAQVASAGSSMMASVILANGFQQIALVDHAKSTMAVYHIDPSSGDIQLKSVRRLDADFALEEYNLSQPTPSTIRKNVR